MKKNKKQREKSKSERQIFTLPSINMNSYKRREVSRASVLGPLSHHPYKRRTGLGAPTVLL